MERSTSIAWYGLGAGIWVNIVVGRCWPILWPSSPHKHYGSALAWAQKMWNLISPAFWCALDLTLLYDFFSLVRAATLIHKMSLAAHAGDFLHVFTSFPGAYSRWIEIEAARVYVICALRWVTLSFALSCKRALRRGCIHYSLFVLSQSWPISNNNFVCPGFFYYALILPFISCNIPGAHLTCTSFFEST